MPQTVKKGRHVVIEGPGYRLRISDDMMRRMRAVEKRHPFLGTEMLVIMLVCEGLQVEERKLGFEQRLDPGPVKPPLPGVRILPFPRPSS